MSYKVHLSPDGEWRQCIAAPGNCKFGGEDGHKNFTDEKEFKAWREEQYKSEHGILADTRRLPKAEYIDVEAVAKNLPHITEEQLEATVNHLIEEEKLWLTSNSLRYANDRYRETDEYFDEVQELRKKYLDVRDNADKIKEFLTEEELAEQVHMSVPKKRVWKRRDPNAKSTYNFHPPVTKSNLEKTVGPMISAYSGRSQEQIEADLADIVKEDGVSLTDATLKYWRGLEQRTDKPIVSLDLETANAMGASAGYDGGQLTYIIELGAIKTYPDGRVERLDFKSGIPERFNKHNGTGYIETHNIEYDEIKDETHFSADEAKQKAVIDFLDGSVMIAHNARFEKDQLNSSLRGFTKRVNEGNIEILDTMIFSKYLVHEGERNTNESFVEAAGLEYKGAHRAYADAEMTLNAFNILRKTR